MSRQAGILLYGFDWDVLRLLESLFLRRVVGVSIGARRPCMQMLAAGVRHGTDKGGHKAVSDGMRSPASAKNVDLPQPQP